MSGKLVKIEVTGQVITLPWIKKGPPEWEFLRDAVGGYIERVRVRWDGRVRDAYVNENGYAEGCVINPSAMRILADPFKGSTIVGPLCVWVPDPKV